MHISREITPENSPYANLLRHGLALKPEDWL
jgi:hypothetical protein